MYGKSPYARYWSLKYDVLIYNEWHRNLNDSYGRAREVDVQCRAYHMATHPETYQNVSVILEEGSPNGDRTLRINPLTWKEY